jgi:cytochrome c biogenesis protein CcmG/thiol:disulfide interchange protein DsbE
LTAATLAIVGPRLSIVLGLLSGFLVAAIGIAVLVVLVPEPGSAVSPSGSPSTSPSASATSSPDTIPSSVPPSASASPLASSSSPVSGSPDTAFHVGQPAPPLVVPQVGGGTVNLGALRGKPVWVNFMQTTCPPCVDEFPLMSGFAARYADEGLIVLAIDIREDEGVVAAFAQSLNANFPIGLDADGAAQRAWGAYGLPVHYWIDADGVVRDGALGGIGPDIMARGLRRIMPGVEVTP